MTKKEIVRQIAADLEVDQTVTKKIVQQCLDRILDVLSETGRIELRNFGVFEIKQRAERKARNPKTNEEVIVPAKRILTFRPGKNVAERLASVNWRAAQADVSPFLEHEADRNLVTRHNVMDLLSSKTE